MGEENYSSDEINEVKVCKDCLIQLSESDPQDATLCHMCRASE